MKYKCLDCGKELKEWQVSECLEEDGEDGTVCYPYCRSNNVENK